MIINRIPILWITINLADPWYPLIIRLARVKLDLGSDVASVFAYKITTMNLMIMAKFFDITYKAVLLSLFISEYCDGDLLGSISIYFEIVKINSRSILYLHCLVWLKKALYLPILCIKF